MSFLTTIQMISITNMKRWRLLRKRRLSLTMSVFLVDFTTMETIPVGLIIQMEMVKKVTLGDPWTKLQAQKQAITELTTSLMIMKTVTMRIWSSQISETLSILLNNWTNLLKLEETRKLTPNKTNLLMKAITILSVKQATASQKVSKLIESIPRLKKLSLNNSIPPMINMEMWSSIT